MFPHFTLEQHRLRIIAHCFFASLGCGTAYIFSAYSTQLADRLGFTATETEFIGISGGMGVSLFGAVAGFIIDKFGSRLPSSVGTVLLFAGYYSIYLAYIHRFQSVILIALALFFAGFGSTLAYNSMVKAAALNFPRSRGTATSFPLAAYGLSAFFFTSVTTAILPQGDTAGFIRTLAFGTSGLCLVNCPWVKVYPQPHDDEVNERPSAEEESLLSEGLSSSSSMVNVNDAEYMAGSSLKDSRGTDSKYNDENSGWRLLLRLEFWEQFILVGFVSGIGQMFIYSVGYCVRALLIQSEPQMDPSKIQTIQALQVALISITNFSFRLLSGFFSDVVSKHHDFQRLWLVVVSSTVGLITQIIAQYMQDAHYMWVLSLLTGSSYGLLFGVMPSIVGESFGMNHFSQNWGWVAAAPVFSSYVLNMLFGKIYDSHSVWLIGDDGTKMHICKQGINCYSQAFFITTLTSLAAIILALYMIWSKKHASHSYSR